MGPRGFPPCMSHETMFQISAQSVEVEVILVTLIPIVLVGIRKVGNDIGTLAVLSWDDPIALNVEVVVGLIRALSC
jgi:hypothetical protein